MRDKNGLPAGQEAIGRRKKSPAAVGPSEVERFLEEVRAAPAPVMRSRLLFALDATASRQPTWDQAAAIQGEMFAQTAALGGLQVQLVYYRGFGECKASRWVAAGPELARMMSRITCLAGRTQIARVLRHACQEARASRLGALVFVGDAVEESVDELGDLAGQLGLLAVPCFLFHEGSDPHALAAFGQIATLSGGAVCRFDSRSPQELRDLLAAVAVYVAGGAKALADFSRRRGGASLLLGNRFSR